MTKLLVEVCYAFPRCIWRKNIIWYLNLDILDIIYLSNFFYLYPEWISNESSVGINGIIYNLKYKIPPNSRLEIYKNLFLDPMKIRINDT